ncbi:MAG: MGH1-like glycoside hydrolase domain-containing protein [Spirochaetota bacterium]
MVKDNVPSVHFYDQDFVDLYNKTWLWIHDRWVTSGKNSDKPSGYLSYEGQETFHQFYSCLNSFFLVYSNQTYSPFPMLDYFYGKQEPSGAIRGEYRIEDGAPVLTAENPEGVHPPLFAFVEYNLYHKVGNKKRLKDVVPVLERYMEWLDGVCKQENGLYSVPMAATLTGNMPREQVVYPVDFNAQMAVNSLYMSAIGDILNDKELSFRYKRQYFSFKTRINSLMWNSEEAFYYDLDGEEQQVTVKTIGSYWTLLAEIPNEDRAQHLIDQLKDPKVFGADNPFPTLAVNDPAFSEQGNGYRGSVFSDYTFMVIKGLEIYKEFEFARECAIRHLYFILDTLHPDGTDNGDVYEAYLPFKEGPATFPGNEWFPRRKFIPMAGLATIGLMIENIVGLVISLPRKTVDWVMPTLEAMGIEDLSLKRNYITILSNKNTRGWEIRLESEKLYYFTIDILDENKRKTLPIPSGKCSMLIDKL